MTCERATPIRSTHLLDQRGAIGVQDESVKSFIFKVLSIRLAAIIHSIISPAQTAFLKTKCIHDSILFVQNTMRALHRRRTSCLLMKIDSAKAFDTVSWEYLLELLQNLGFSAQWRG